MSRLTLDLKLTAKMSVTPCIDRDILVALGEDDGERGWGGGGMRGRVCCDRGKGCKRECGKGDPVWGDEETGW